jgi:hypothetical protein
MVYSQHISTLLWSTSINSLIFHVQRNTRQEDKKKKKTRKEFHNFYYISLETQSKITQKRGWWSSYYFSSSLIQIILCCSHLTDDLRSVSTFRADEKVLPAPIFNSLLVCHLCYKGFFLLLYSNPFNVHPSFVIFLLPQATNNILSFIFLLNHRAYQMLLFYILIQMINLIFTLS